MKGYSFKKLSFTVIAALILVSSFPSAIPKVLAATGGGTATIAVDDGTQGAGVTVVQSTSHVFKTVLTIPTGGMTKGASSPTFTIPTDFTAPNTHSVETAGLVVADGQWSVVAGGCTVDSSSSSSTSVASGQVITVDITADCAVNNTITLTYKGTSATAMGATQLVVSTANAGETLPVQPLTAGSPTITVTAAPTPTPTQTPTPTPTPTAAPTPTPTQTPTPTSTPIPGLTSTPTPDPGTVLGSTSNYCPPLSNQIVAPLIIESRRINPQSIYIKWGPYSGVDTFNVEYGFENGKFLYNTNVTGFFVTINDLPLNQPIWIRVAARNECQIGTYGESKLVGGPGLPNTGIKPENIKTMMYILIGSVAILIFLVQKDRKTY